ncbi:Uncharacterized membrane protein [Microlunatus soli]|uniref:Uncharacterized membrane protein n=1 Tax=Microlunatus soli TaxID=630515 RepID=A0A1H1V4T4_9ACTN|nr:Uncharacterized membrane protein [Microlunatus soli]
MRQLKALRLMIVILIPIAIWTVVGLIWLWPHDVSDHIREDTSTYSAKGVTLPKAEITKVQRTSCQGQVGSVSGSGDQKSCGNITAKLLEGPEQGREVQVVLTEAQFRSGVEVGQKVKLVRVPAGTQGGAQASYQFSDFDRTVPLIVLAGAFALAVIIVARWRGFASLIGLGFAAFILIKFMFPAMVSGSNPILVGLIGSVAIMFVVLYTAHGFSARTTTALLGTLFGLLVTAGLGWAMSSWAHLTGISAEDDYLLAASAPDMALTSVVLCGIIVAGLGVLNDVTITQASAVWELAESDPDQKKLFSRAMRIGRDHIASSVYTIAFATAGAGLATLLLITVYNRPLGEVAQTEALSEEIVRTLVGAIGLVLAMPLTTAVGVAVVAAGRIGRKPAEQAAGGSGSGGAAKPAAAKKTSGKGAKVAASKRTGTKEPAETPVGAVTDSQRVRPTAATTAPLDERETTRLPRIRRDDDSAAGQPAADGTGSDETTETKVRSRRSRSDDESFNFADLREDDAEDDQPRGRRWR